jgi:hypothetical protein
MAATYTSVTSGNSTFKQPRQKMWAVFSRPNNQYGGSFWELTLVSNDLQEAKEKVNDWLKNPPTGQYAKPGLDNVILCELAPIDSDVLV